MHKFQAAFSRRRSNPSESAHAQPPQDQPSFRVLERSIPQATPRGFDGGAKMARPPAPPVPRHLNSQPVEEDNMFANLNANRGSGASNSTKATSTDTSSRHSNASTAPSSADIPNAHDDRAGKRKTGQGPKTGSSSFLDRASRTFSFGGSKKGSTPKEEQSEQFRDIPPLPTFQREDEYGRTRAMTASTTSTATPQRLDALSSGENSPLDMGGDFSSMFSGSSIDKRASMATIKNLGGVGNNRSGPPAPLNTEHGSNVEPGPSSWGGSYNSSDPMSPNSTHSSAFSPAVLSPAVRSPGLLSPSVSSPVVRSPVGLGTNMDSSPRHQPSFESRSPRSPGGMMDDEDARLLAESVGAARFFGAMSPGVSPQPSPNIAKTAQFPSDHRPGASSYANQSSSNSRQTLQGQTKVMTPAQFERYQKEKEREGMLKAANNEKDSDDEDEINYDDDEDEEERIKRMAKQRREQQQSMLAYRQKNMKMSGDVRSTAPLSPGRPGLPSSLSAPQIFHGKSSPDLPRRFDEEEDEDVPLALLNRAGSRLSTVGSQPNMRASMLLQPGQLPGRPLSGYMADPIPMANKRQSHVPAFARGLPNDPFNGGGGGSRSPGRDSMSMSGGSMGMHGYPGPQMRQQGPVQPGGLIGVIANEERQRAMRRGSPSVDPRRLSQMGGPGIDPIAGIPPQMMYSGNQNMSRNSLYMGPGDQNNMQQMQLMQMQMQWMQMQQMMQNNNMSPQHQQQMMILQQQAQQGVIQPQQVSPQMPQMGFGGGFGGLQGNHSVTNFSSAQSIAGGQLRAQPGRLDAGTRTMSMVQPTSPFLQTGFGPSGHSPNAGYTPSIAPSERSNIGLPGRYRPVSQAGSMANHGRSQSFSAGLSLSHLDGGAKSKSTVKLVDKMRGQESDDDDEQGWEAMKAKREQKRRLKK